MGINYKGPKVAPKIDLGVPTGKITPTDRLIIESEIDLIDTGEYFQKALEGSLDADRYRKLAEVYAHQYDNHYQDISTLLHIEGVLVEMYSDIYGFEKKGGETTKSRQQKERLLLLRNGVETLKKYFTKYDQLKMIHKETILENHRLYKENKELRTRLDNIEKAENYNGLHNEK